MVTISFNNPEIESKYSTDQLENKLSDFLTNTSKKGTCLFQIDETDLPKEALKSYKNIEKDTFLDI
ncbi:MAG: hypothetical protein GY828_05455 [Candidatus Gracilibacteria bacterium]|nr:hypothetical protein [Candidatus Gracilibacteria bacterium]